MWLILRSQTIVTEIPHNTHKICFQAIWMTFICDLKIDIILQPHQVNFLKNLMHSCFTL